MTTEFDPDKKLNSRDMTKKQLLQEFIVVQEALSKQKMETLFQQGKSARLSENLEQMSRLVLELASFASAMAVCELVNSHDTTANDMVQVRINNSLTRAAALMVGR